MINPQSIYYDADTFLEEVFDMPDDIKNLFDESTQVTENDMTDYYAPVGEELPEEFDDDIEQQLKDHQDNACCPSASYAAKVFCGCGGSGEMPEHLRKYLEDRE